MKTFALLFAMFSLSVGPSVGAHTGLGLTLPVSVDAARYRRSLIDLAMMELYATGRNPLDYAAYGCYCGIGGRGKPVDDIDRCCQAHDNCYSDLTEKKICKKFQLFVLPYKTSSPLVCDSSNTGCAMGLCECDRDVALCLRGKKYNEKYKYYNKLKC